MVTSVNTADLRPKPTPLEKPERALHEPNPSQNAHAKSRPPQPSLTNRSSRAASSYSCAEQDATRLYTPKASTHPRSAWVAQAAPTLPQVTSTSKSSSAAFKDAPKEVKALFEEVKEKLPSTTVTSFTFKTWESTQKTSDGEHPTVLMGIAPISVNHNAYIQSVMDVKGFNAAQKNTSTFCTTTCTIREDTDPKKTGIQFYQSVSLMSIITIQHELMLNDYGTVQIGSKFYRIAAWHLLTTETGNLNDNQGKKSTFNAGLWLTDGTQIIYVVSSAIRKDALNWLEKPTLSAALSKSGEGIVKSTIDGMIQFYNEQNEPTASK